jgi:hypothetical protein
VAKANVAIKGDKNTLTFFLSPLWHSLFSKKKKLASVREPAFEFMKM